LDKQDGPCGLHGHASNLPAAISEVRREEIGGLGGFSLKAQFGDPAF